MTSLVASPALREGRILGGKLGSIKKFPKNSWKYWGWTGSWDKKLRIFRTILVGGLQIVRFQGKGKKIIEKKRLVQKIPKNSGMMLVL
jgi:hypothetical protein